MKSFKTNRNQSGMATWVKGLIAVIAVCLIIIFVSLVICGIALKDNFDSSYTPARSKAVLEKIVEFKPLPEKYEFLSGVEIFSATQVVVINDNSNALKITVQKRFGGTGISHCKDSQSRAECLLDYYLDQDSTVLNGNPMMKKVSRGTSKLLGDDFPYAVGIIKPDDREEQAKFMGCITTDDKESVIVISAEDYSEGESFDIKKIEEFLSYITAIK